MDSTRFFQALPDDHPKKMAADMWGHDSSQFEDAVDVRHAWFDYWLHDIDTGVMDLPRVDSGLNTGERTQQEDWPPRKTTEIEVSLTRSVDTPDAGPPRNEMTLKGSGDPVYLESDPPLTEPEMFSDAPNRGTHLKFHSDPLDEDVRISGWPLLDIHARSIHDSTHYAPVLYDRAPEGEIEIITRGFLNARNRNRHDTSEPVPADGPYHFPVELWDIDWVVAAGHQLGLVVASSNPSGPSATTTTRTRTGCYSPMNPRSRGPVLTLPVSSGHRGPNTLP